MPINRLTCHNYLAAVLLSHKISFNKPVSQQVRLNSVLESYSSKDSFFSYLAFHLFTAISWRCGNILAQQ